MKTEHCEESHVCANKPHELAESCWLEADPGTSRVLIPVTAGHSKFLKLNISFHGPWFCQILNIIIKFKQGVPIYTCLRA